MSEGIVVVPRFLRFPFLLSVENGIISNSSPNSNFHIWYIFLFPLHLSIKRLSGKATGSLLCEAIYELYFISSGMKPSRATILFRRRKLQHFKPITGGIEIRVSGVEKSRIAFKADRVRPGFRHLTHKEIVSRPMGAYFFCQICDNICCMSLYDVV